MNKAILMGRLTRDPEVRYSQNNLPITTFTLAVNRRFARQGDEIQADFIPVVAFGKTAEFCEKYYRKGQQVLIAGRIQVRSWDDNEGKRRYITEIVCEDGYFADAKRQDHDGDAGGRQDDYGYYPQAGQDSADSPYGPGAQAFGVGGGNAMQRPAIGDDRAPDRRRSGGASGGAAGGSGGVAGGSSGGRTNREAPQVTDDDDGFMPIDNENDLPF